MGRPSAWKASRSQSSFLHGSRMTGSSTFCDISVAPSCPRRCRRQCPRCCRQDRWNKPKPISELDAILVVLVEGVHGCLLCSGIPEDYSRERFYGVTHPVQKKRWDLMGYQGRSPWLVSCRARKTKLRLWRDGNMKNDAGSAPNYSVRNYPSIRFSGPLGQCKRRRPKISVRGSSHSSCSTTPLKGEKSFEESQELSFHSIHVRSGSTHRDPCHRCP